MPAASRITGITTANLPSPRSAIRAAAQRAAGTGGRRYWLRLLPALAVLAALTHLPSFLRAVWNPDEGFLATEARLLSHGGVLYQSVVDRKPPLVPWLYEGALGLFGDSSLWPLRLAAVLAHLVTAALLASIARRRWGDRAGVAAGAGYLLVSIGLAPQDAQAATFEVFMLPWTVAAFWCADRRRWALAGLAVAGAALTKQTGGAVLLPVIWLLWRSGTGSEPYPASARRTGPLRTATSRTGAMRTGSVRTDPLRTDPLRTDPLRTGATRASASPAGGRTRGAVALALGFLLPSAVAALALGPGRFLFWTVTGSGAYASAGGAWLTAAGRAFGNAAIVAAACAGLLIPAAYLLARRRFSDADLWIWLGASMVAVVTGFQFFGHYYLQLLPPLVLIGVGALRALPHWRRPALAWTALAACGFLLWGLAAPRTDLDHAHTVAAAVSRHTAPHDKVLVWGMHPEEYWLAGRDPASRFLTAGFLTNFSGGRDGVRVGERYAVPGAWHAFQAEMRHHPPALVVDDSRGQPYGPSHVPAFRALLRAHYHPVGVSDGAVLYARRGPRIRPAAPPPGRAVTRVPLVAPRRPRRGPRRGNAAPGRR
jgi:hypothetical protein